MSKRHTIYLIYRDGVFVDACLSYSEAARIATSWDGHKWEIKQRTAEDY
jgi:hypothetical protein